MNPTECTAFFMSNRSRLFGLAYRLLGSRADADDVMQEAWLRWQGAGEMEKPGVVLRRIVANLSIDLLRKRRRERDRYTGPWLPEPLPDEDWDDEGPESELDRHQSLSLGFLHLLEALGSVERAVFVLREGFGSEFDEIGLLLGKTAANCRQLFSRARRRLGEGAVRAEASPDVHAGLLGAFLMACRTGDVAAIEQYLARDVVLYSDGGGKVKAALRPIYGADKVIRFLLALLRKQPDGLNMEFRSLNGRLALVVSDQAGPVQVFSIRAGERGIEQVYMVLNPDKLRLETEFRA